MNPALLGLIRGLGVVVLTAILTYLGDSANISPVLSPYLATVVSAMALALEHAIEGNTGKALFGAVRTN